ncbi:dipeptidyl aminopeptidase/acylaminoacyl peptidase [Litorimonas taeanensis]|uniref:Dipeptidyl aminopeptidase/acylaminoacyl peptidase n=1 Tax=Litorimonas taeanensis TaxID=568099 RepID=A0A420WIP0_9PROT|nr:prolyl oligopeptidase family serine peptidase [Litorimonas taeanensis]RKQ70873.1 dipeptidyl aminopeptidase/acylaminoacyl peptidase [Litorimonas taeanensis]
MKKILLTCVAALGILAVAPISEAATSVKPYPMDYWAAPNFMDNVSLSPNGKFLAFRKADSQKGDHIIEVYEADNMAKKPKRLGAKSMRIRGFSWVGDEEMVVSFNKQVSKKIKGFNRGAFKSKLALYSLRTNKFNELNADDFNLSLVNGLVNEPNHVLVRYSFFDRSKSFRAPSYYRYNLKTGSKQLVLKGNDDMFGYRFDEDGNPRFANEFDEGSKETVFLYRDIGGSGWNEYYRQSQDSFETFQYGGIVDGTSDEIYVIAHNGNDKEGLWKYNLKTKSFGELVYRRNDVDLAGTVRHTNSWSNPGVVTGVRYGKDKYHVKYFDKSEEAMMKQFEQAIPNAHLLSVSSRSRDGDVLVMRNSGPRDPGSYYLFNKGKLSLVGSVNGLLKGKDLADVEYITYTSRDGKKIPAYVTRPQGKGPFPLIVMPHGGPFVSEVVGWDDWGQMLANNGYMVLQPQYRGSQNYGLEYYQSAFINGGEGGKKMQDDKDDGVKYLISKGDVDPDRVAMFGWSYGGYAALIAAAREPNIYQCVIAGAAVADNLQQVNYYRDRLDGAQEVEQVNFWDGSISPIEETDKVNVPMLIIHGSVDQRVPITHSDKYSKALDKSGKSYEYIALENADHFSNTLDYDHKMKAYPRMMSFLKKDCGPGGL